MRQQVSSGTLAFVSNARQLHYLASTQMARLHGDIHFICLTPAAEYEAGKMGVKHSSVEDLYSPDELMRIGSEGYESCEMFARYIDREINTSFNSICAKGYFSSVLFVYLLKTIYDTALSKLHILLSTIEALSPSRVICFTDNQTISHFGQNYYIGDLNYQTLELLKDRFKYELVSYNVNVPPGKTSRRLWFIGILRGMNTRVRLMLKQMMRLTYHVTRRIPETGTIAIGHDNGLAMLNDYISEWQNTGGRVVSFAKMMRYHKLSSADIDRSPLLAKFGITVRNLENFWRRLSSDREFSKWFEYRNINFSTVTTSWLQQFIRFTFPTCVLAGEFIEKKLSKYRVSAFLTPSVCHRNEVAAILACKRLGIKVYSVQHGAMGYFKLPIIEYTDYLGIDYALVYGQAISNFFRQEFHIDGRKEIAQPVAVGNPCIYSLFNKERDESQLSKGTQRRMLYIPSHFIPDFYYFGWNYYPNIWYSRLQRRIVDTVKSFPEVTLYVKQYFELPVEDPLQKYAADEDIRNAVFLPNYLDMSRFLDEVDLFIIDFPSTSLLKILCTRKPVITYYNPDYLQMSADARELLRTRTAFCLTEEELVATMEKFCGLPSWPELKDPDDTFLTHYGLCEQDIEAEKQVVKHLLSCLDTVEISNK